MLSKSSFSNDDRYYAQVGNGGKLRIWDTGSTHLIQEYTPDIHLTSPFTQLQWITFSKICSTKRKRTVLESADSEKNFIALGNRSGNVLLYSVSTATITEVLEGGHNNHINSIAWNRTICDKLYTSSDDQYIVEWDLSNKSVTKKWKCGRVSCIAVSSDGKSLIAAKKEIKWWDISSESHIKTFIGHASDVINLMFATISDVECVLSASSGDRQIHAWVLNNNEDRQAVTTFCMDDCLTSLSVKNSLSGGLNILACSKTGVLHFYSCILNGKNYKPTKPKLTVQIACEEDNNKSVEQIPVIGGVLLDETSAYIAYGNDIFLSFEKLSLQMEEKAMFIVRQDPRKKLFSSREVAVSKVMPISKTKNVQYVHPDLVNGVVPGMGKKAQKRNQHLEKTTDVPLELRLENLAVGVPNTINVAPSSDSLVHLLLQGLRSKDSKILNEALLQHEDSVVKTTISRLPVEAIVPFSIELISMLQGKPAECNAAVKWLKQVVVLHAAHLISNPNITEIFAPLFPIVESKLNVLGPLCRLAGRLDLMIEQIEDRTNDTIKMLQNIDHQPRLVYQDEDSDESNNSEVLEDNMSPNDSEEQWDEISEIDASCGEEEEDDEDEEMQNDEIDAT